MPLFLINILLLILWLRLLPLRDEKTFFNPYVASSLHISERISQFLRPVTGALPSNLVSILLLLFLIVFRGVVASSTGLPWVETIGLWRFTVPARSASMSVCFSFISFFWLLHRLWTLHWIISILRGGRRETRAYSALAAFAMPFSLFSRVLQGVSLILFGALLAPAMQWGALPAIPVDTAGVLQLPLPASSNPVILVFALGAIVDVLSVASHLVIILILITFLGALMRSMPAGTIGNEGLDLLVGSVFSKPLTIGGISLAPIIFFLLAGFLHSFLLGIIYQFIQSLS